MWNELHFMHLQDEFDELYLDGTRVTLEDNNCFTLQAAYFLGVRAGYDGIDIEEAFDRVSYHPNPEDDL